MDSEKKTKITYYIIYALCVIVIATVGTILLKMETTDKSVIMQAESNIDVKDDTAVAVNINTATKEELMLLENIGASKAEDIIEYRKEHPFTKPEDLMNVPGIGEKTFERLKDKITVN